MCITVILMFFSDLCTNLNGVGHITLTLIASGINARIGAIAMPVQVKFSNPNQSHSTKPTSLSNGQVKLGTWPATVFADAFLIVVTVPRKLVAKKMLTEFIQDNFLTGGDLVDTKFYVFTRLNGHTADVPKSIYANSKFLLAWSSEYLTDCKLQNDFPTI